MKLLRPAAIASDELRNNRDATRRQRLSFGRAGQRGVVDIPGRQPHGLRLPCVSAESVSLIPQVRRVRPGLAAGR
jgi:hypothetical protein